MKTYCGINAINVNIMIYKPFKMLQATYSLYNLNYKFQAFATLIYSM